MTPLFGASTSDSIADSLYETFRELGHMQCFLPPQVFDNKDTCDQVLSKLFNIVIEAGITSYTFESRHDSTLNATNYLKRDKNYYEILSSQWQRTVSDLNAVFAEVGM